MSDEKNNPIYGTDEELMLSYQQGDSQAFNALYDRIANKLYGYLYRRIRSKELVDDIFQATMTKFHLTRMQYRPPLPVMPWAFTICRTVMIDTLRKQERRKESLDDMRDYEAASHPAVEPLASNSSGELLGMRTLSKTQKDALSLRFEHDLSFEEIAGRLETSPANARQLVSRALKKIKTLTKARQQK